MTAGPLDRGRYAQVEAWLADDPDPTTAAALSATFTRATHGEPDAQDEIEAGFAGQLQFGTAGLRAPMGWGPRRMNRLTVGRAAAGFTKWLKAHGAGPVVVGYDARHNSKDYALDTAQICAGAGLPTFLLPYPLPTPVLAFAIGALRAAAGIMVTASHNPAHDNGCKVYVGRRQISAPVDAEIARAIDEVTALRDVPRSDAWVSLDDDVVSQYLDRAARLVAPRSPTDLSVVYTPIHGVAGPVLLAAFERAGLPAPQVVSEQADPDPDFPTVASPNPEDPAALRLALALGANVDADLVIATDPDGDRMAVAVPDPSRRPSAWRILTGDEVGDLLGQYLAEDPRPGAFATTIVSSTRLAAIAARHHRRFTRTLTGFKWLATVPDLRYAYEEAIGYCVDPDAVLDKDGITAALVVVGLAAELRTDGLTLLDALDDLDRSFGVHLTEQVTITADGSDPQWLPRRLAAITADPPSRLAGLRVTQVDDLAAGADDRPPTPGLRLLIASPWPDSVITVVLRPSGTEPKLKAYLQVARSPGRADLVDEQRRAAADLLALLHADVTQVLS